MMFRVTRRKGLLIGVAVLGLVALGGAVRLATLDQAGLRSSRIPMAPSTTGAPAVGASSPAASAPTDRPTGGSPSTSSATAVSAPPASTAAPRKAPPGPASSLAAAGDCVFYPDAPRAAVLLSWTVGAPAGDAQRVELSSVPRGLDTGRFLSSPSLSGQQPEFLWEAMITAGQTYSWRVVTSSGAMSASSPAHTFVAAPCLQGGAGQTP